MSEYLTVTEAATILNRSRRTVHGLVKSNALPASRAWPATNAPFLIPRAAVEALARQRGEQTRTDAEAASRAAHPAGKRLTSPTA